MNRKKVIYPIISAVFASLLVITVWFTMPSAEPSATTFASIDFPVYSSAEELTAASDAVVIGSVKGVVGHEVDYGTSNPDKEYGTFKDQIHGVAMVYYEIDVTKTLKGETAKTIIVAGMDMNQTTCDQVTPLQDGEEVLLFLMERTQKDAPGLKLYENFYVTVSLDNGVFDVLDDNTVQPRYAEAFVEPNEDGTFTSPTYNLTEVSEKIQSVN
jgi:hypothetical protein